MDKHANFPKIKPAGVTGMLVQFGDALDERANRAALAFRQTVEAQNWDGVEETASSLVSVLIRIDPLRLPHSALSTGLDGLLRQRNWYDADLPSGRRLWHVPTVYGGTLAPQLEDAAEAAGLTMDAAVASLSGAQVRVQTIGFAPGMPYLGQLPPEWDIPRQTNLTPRVPAGALVVAIRQLVLFPVSTPTGWQHVGQTALPLFQPDAQQPFLLRPGDEVTFPAVSEASFAALQSAPNGGATWEALS